MQRVFYRPQEQSKLVLECVAYFASYIASLPEDVWVRDKSVLDWFFVNWLHSLLIGMKPEAFNEEMEWRLTNRNWTQPQCSFRASRSGLIVPYREFHFANEPLPISRVFVGPTNHPEIALRSTRQLLRKHGYADVEVVFCDIPLREL